MSFPQKNCSSIGLFHGYSPSGMDRSSAGPPRATGATRKLNPECVPLPRPQLALGPCPGVGSSWAAAFFRACTPAALWGPPETAVWISALPWYSRGCRGISTPASEAILPFLLLHWPCCLQGCFSHIVLTPLIAAKQCLLHFLKHVNKEVPPALLMGSTVSWGVFTGAGTSCVQHRVALGFFSQKQPAAPLL